MATGHDEQRVLCGKPAVAQGGALDIEARCPGWRAWLDERAGWWYAHRAGEYFQAEGSARLYLVAARDAEGLVDTIDQQIFLDLVAEYPEWEFGLTRTGRWWAVQRGEEKGRLALRAETPAGLGALLRDYLRPREIGRAVAEWCRHCGRTIRAVHGHLAQQHVHADSGREPCGPADGTVAEPGGTPPPAPPAPAEQPGSGLLIVRSRGLMPP